LEGGDRSRKKNYLREVGSSVQNDRESHKNPKKNEKAVQKSPRTFLKNLDCGGGGETMDGKKKVVLSWGEQGFSTWKEKVGDYEKNFKKRKKRPCKKAVEVSEESCRI